MWRRGALVVLLGGAGHELKASEVGEGTHAAQRRKDVVRFQRQVLHARAAVVVEVRLDLRFALGAGGGLVDGQQHKLAVVREHHAVQPRVHRAHVLARELRKLVHACARRGVALVRTAPTYRYRHMRAIDTACQWRAGGAPVIFMR